MILKRCRIGSRGERNRGRFGVSRKLEEMQLGVGGVEANYETCQTQRDALKQELEELKEELLKASSREKLEEEKAEMENAMKKKAQKAVENTEENTEENANASSE